MNLGPLVVLHDHLDGGVRPSTVLDLAERLGVSTPVDNAAALAEWMTITPALSLPDAFSRFDLVGSLLQGADALERVAQEALEDLAADGVIYAELRFAPLLHTVGGLSPNGAIAAVQRGLVAGMDGTGIQARLLCCAMRDQPVEVSEELVRAAVVAARDGLVVGVDLAGIEPGFPAELHARAFDLARQAGLKITVHAGEMDGAHQVASAMGSCHPDRIGHGWRLIDDCVVDDGHITALGSTALAVRDGRVPLEMCLTSNAALGKPIASHPAAMLRDAGFLVTLSPDDRSITTTTASAEHRHAAELLGFSRADLAHCNERAAVAAFCDDQQRAALVEAVHAGWAQMPSRLVHLAERERWRSAGDTYLPAEFAKDGFVHLSGLHQLLTPANRFYRGRHDLVALVVDPNLLGPGLVWEAGTETLERFPHYYAAIERAAVVDEIALHPASDGSFLLPQALVAACASGT